LSVAPGWLNRSGSPPPFFKSCNCGVRCSKILTWSFVTKPVIIPVNKIICVTRR